VITTETDRRAAAGLDLTVTLAVTWRRRLLAVGGGLVLLAAGIGLVAAWYQGVFAPTLSLRDPLVLGLVAIPVGLVCVGRGRRLGLVLDERGITRHHLLYASTLRWSRVRRVWVVRDDRAPLEEGVSAVLVWSGRRARRLDRGLGRRRANALALFVEDEGRAREIPTHMGSVPAARPPQWRLPRRAPVRRTADGGVELRRPVALATLLAGPPVLAAAGLVALGLVGRIELALAVTLAIALGLIACEFARRGVRARVLLGEEQVVVRGIARRRVLEVAQVAWVGASRPRRLSPTGVALLALGLGEPDRGEVVQSGVAVPGRRRTNARIWCAARDWADARGIATEPMVRLRWGTRRYRAPRPDTFAARANPWRLRRRRRAV
jgi:hypothetical protein